MQGSPTVIGKIKALNKRIKAHFKDSKNVPEYIRVFRDYWSTENERRLVADIKRFSFEGSTEFDFHSEDVDAKYVLAIFNVIRSVVPQGATSTVALTLYDLAALCPQLFIPSIEKYKHSLHSEMAVSKMVHYVNLLYGFGILDVATYSIGVQTNDGTQTDLKGIRVSLKDDED